MGENSNIEWTHHTFNPWIGCSKVSPGCKNCYAEADMDKRRGRVAWGINGTRSVTSYAYWRKVLSWNRDAQNERKRVFCASLADVFEDWGGNIIDSHGGILYWPQYNSWEEFERRNDGLKGTVFESQVGSLHFELTDCDGIPTFSHYDKKYVDQCYDHDYGDDRIISNSQHKKTFFKPLTVDIIRSWLFKLIEATPNLDWLLLTKRPENIMKMIPDHWQNKFPENIWVGTSVEDQEQAEIRIPHLSNIPSAVRFLSCEPMLEEIHLPYRNYNWVIVGGESGKNKRPFNAEWARIVRDFCDLNEIPFFMKQMDKIQPIPNDLLIRQFP